MFGGLMGALLGGLLGGLVAGVGGQALTRGCPLQVTIDPFLWGEYRGREVEGKEGEARARFHLTNVVSRLVNSANSVLAGHYFGNHKYGLILQDIQILADNNCSSLGFDLCSLDLSMAELLDGFSYTPHDSYCLSYLLTFRDFPDGKLGLAWTAVGEDGGVCDTYRLHREVYRASVNKSLNTGVVSLSRGGRQVSERVAALAFSHEVGHSLGAQHDSPDCSSRDFLMAGTGSLGRRASNMQLSPCSTAAISSLLPSRAGCWRVSSGRGVCGNSVVEGWEQCDCGSDPELCRQLCCVPSTGGPSGLSPCTRTTAPNSSQPAPCSPSEGLCCSSSCQLLPPTDQCSAPTDCALPALCTGNTALCPRPPPQPEGAPCDGGARTCAGGTCTGSVCQSRGALPCNLYSNDSRAACSVQCRGGGGECGAVEGLRLPEGEECRVGGGFGHCNAGVCSVQGSERQTWVVGVAGCLVAYMLLSCVLLWCYCNYCRGGRIKTSGSAPLPTEGSSTE